MTSKRSTKLRILHPQSEEADSHLVGILEQLAPEQPTHGRKIAIILHGTMGHKDYLFQKRLALHLPIDSFRFDFRGNHESGGKWKQGGFPEDVEDLVAVVAYLRNEYGYEIDMVVGHSRGSVVAMHWLCTSEEGKQVSTYVNIAGRYRMNRIYDGLATWKEEFDTKGYYEWKVPVAQKLVVQKIYPKDLEDFSRWNSAVVWDRFPSSTDILTIQGLADKTVPPFDAIIYARIFGQRSPGTHNLHIIEEADHNFTGRREEVVDCILDWLEARKNGGLKTGVWMTGIRGKL